MLKIENENKILLTKGDTLDLQVTILDPSGEPYILQESDKVRFALKRNGCDENVIINKQLDHDTLEVRLESSETKQLSTYEVYKWDLELTSGTNVDTFLVGTLQMTEEVA